ncbi:ATP-grasp domain protein [Botrimarina mediterranea]|uniref:ATP-grasp domain protein n=1 Tax=Botrimarina mediterranea TaxID=2528022 RepID=A0A518K396_9BACT|nr:ATP-grasp domain protein [Botrimarina mediterranea]
MVPSERPTRLAIVGASVRAAAQSALRAGFEVVGADLFADADLDGVCPITKIEDYPHGFVDWLAKQDVDAWMYTGALENYPDLVDQMAAIRPLWGVSGEALRRCRDPSEYGYHLFKADVPYPATIRATPGKSYKTYWPWGPSLAKSYRQSNGAGVWRINNQDDYDRAVNLGMYIQDHLQEGESLSALFVADTQGATLLGLSEQLVGDSDNEFHYRGSIGPLAPSVSHAITLDNLGRCLSSSLGLRGVVGVDLIQFEQLLCVIEINPRYTASVEVIERANGVSAVAAHAACFAEGLEPGTESQPGKHVGKRILYAAEPIQVGESLAGELLELHRAGRVADVPRAGTAIGAGEPICTILVESESCSAVAEGLDALAEILLARFATRG